MAFDKVKYDNEFVKANYDRVEFTIPKGKGKTLREYAKSQGKSVTQVIVESLESHCKLDLSKQGGE